MKFDKSKCVGLLGVFLTAAFGTPAVAATCASLASAALKAATVTRAEVVPPGTFAPPDGGRRGGTRTNPYKDLPEFCRVAATLTPSSDSDIKVEVWLPTRTWNGKFQAVGNGGWAGVISYSAMADAVRARLCDGVDRHRTRRRPAAAFALGHPEKLIDFAWRSEHEMTVQGQGDRSQTFYGSAPRLSYWNGCSTGGRQGAEGSADVPGRLRRHHRGRAGEPHGDLACGLRTRC